MKRLRNFLWRLADRDNYDFLAAHGMLDKYWSELEIGQKKEPSVIPLWLIGAAWLVLQALYTTGCANQAFYGQTEPDSHFSKYSP